MLDYWLPMPPVQPQRAIFRFGAFEADAARGELRKAGMRIHLQEQPFQVLLILLERQGEVVTREDLRLALWGSDTFVDFDHSLNTAINKLRDAVGDSAASPRFIQTVARRGYRFLPPVERVNAEGVPSSPAQNHEPGEISSRAWLTHPSEPPRAPGALVRALFAGIQVMYLAFYLSALARLGETEARLAALGHHPQFFMALLIVTAAAGIPLRMYLLSGISFQPRGLQSRFQRLFPVLFILDELWALSPFLLRHFPLGLALAATAALLYLPFSQRTLMLMAYRKAAG